MFFLGLDCSTQSLSALLIEFKSHRIIWEHSIIFESTFPEYRTRSGTLQAPSSLVVHSPPMMWLEALDALFKAMQTSHIDLKQIQAIAGSAQQHGSVYLKKQFASKIAHLDPNKTLKENLQGTLARQTAPIWMDASTAQECLEIKQAVGQKVILISKHS